MWIWVCGPFASNGASEAEREANQRALNAAAYLVWQKGHVPIIGVNMARPMIEAAGLSPVSHEIREPFSFALMERCDACLRIGGPSLGAEREAQRFSYRRLPVFNDVIEIAPAPIL